jgi:uncharacterized membrane protein
VSDRALRALVAVLALAGLAIATYLTIVAYTDSAPVCAGGGGGCEKVQSSEYSELAGVPVALLGAIGYVLILGSLALPGDLGRMSGALLALVGAGFSAYLTYVSAAVIEALCQWCLASTVVMALLALVAVWRVARDPAEGARSSPG